jgi:hypothetical protein
MWFTGRFAGGVYNDITTRFLPHYLSDWKDGLCLKAGGALRTGTRSTFDILLRGLHSFPIQLNLSSSVHRIILISS